MKIKLIKLPCLGACPLAIDFNIPSILPLSIGVLAGKLRSEGYFVEVDDNALLDFVDPYVVEKK